MLCYHQEGVTLTLEFSDSEIAFFQEGLAMLLLHLSYTANDHPLQESMLYTLTSLVAATALTESQHSTIREGLLKIKKLSKQNPAAIQQRD